MTSERDAAIIDLVERLDQIDTHIANWRASRDEIEEALLVAMGEDKALTIDGLGLIERHGRAKRTKWDSEMLLRAVLDARIVDPDTGEITEQTPLERVQMAYSLTGSNVRITALKDLGISPDEYCEERWGRPSIRITR